MQDEIIMNTLLSLSKNACDILFHGTIESRDKAEKTFKESLNEYLDNQSELFTVMEEKGLYNLENAGETKIKKTCQKYSKI